MAKDGSSMSTIRNGATLPEGKGKVDIRLQGFTRGSYGAETMEDRLAATPPQEEEIL